MKNRIFFSIVAFVWLMYWATLGTNYDIYFAIIGLIWLTIWASIFEGLRQRDISGSFLGSNRWKKFLILGIVCVVFPCGYLVSYAPFLHFQRSLIPTLQVLRDLYVPAEWVIDHTWLRHPLIWWAATWGVDQQVVMDSAGRLRYAVVWGTTPPWLYCFSWVAIGAVLSGVPPYVLNWTQKKLRIRFFKPSQALPN